jgi:hypothetical protein
MILADRPYLLGRSRLRIVSGMSASVVGRVSLRASASKITQCYLQLKAMVEATDIQPFPPQAMLLQHTTILSLRITPLLNQETSPSKEGTIMEVQVSTEVIVWMSATLDDLESLTDPVKVTRDSSLHMLHPGVQQVLAVLIILLIIHQATTARTEVGCNTTTQLCEITRMTVLIEPHLRWALGCKFEEALQLASSLLLNSLLLTTRT